MYPGHSRKDIERDWDDVEKLQSCTELGFIQKTGFRISTKINTVKNIYTCIKIFQFI